MPMILTEVDLSNPPGSKHHPWRWDSKDCSGVFGTAITTLCERNRGLLRAALEAIALQVRDTLEDIQRTVGAVRTVLRVDGGARDDLLMQFQADILGITVERPRTLATAPVGAAHLAGLAVGFWESLEEVSALWRGDRHVDPQMTEDERATRYAGSLAAVAFTNGLNRTNR